jgi:hypothetical protein
VFVMPVTNTTYEERTTRSSVATTHSAPNHYLDLAADRPRYWDLSVEPEAGFEPAAYALRVRCSTPELPRHEGNHTGGTCQASGVETLHPEFMRPILDRVLEVQVDSVCGPKRTYVPHGSERRRDPPVLQPSKRSAIG